VQIDFSKIKLIIWDLDNTFWNGIISETEIEINIQNIQLIKDLTAVGIINSICSKNTHEVCEQKLKGLDIYNYFVFPSINWSAKGFRIKELINAMSLRPANVLFIDDDITNLNEAQFYAPELMIAEPTILPSLISYISKCEKKDINHSRLKQYKLLETKQKEQENYSTNEDFLFASNIKVDIKLNCLNEIDRIHELIQRSNQLNFTKKRISKQELEQLLMDSDYNFGYIEVNDKYGEYGIVGFYAIKDYNLEHFTFSCRTIGLGVEQFVYAQLGFPELTIIGEVVNTVDKKSCPLWINNDKQKNIENKQFESKNNSKQLKILLKGPCDLSKTMNYLPNSDKFVSEFTYINSKSNNSIEAHNHSVHIVGLKKYSQKDKDILANECIFIDRDMLDGTLFSTKYDLIILSTLIESNFGIYQRKGSDLQIAFGSYLSPLTNSENWNDYIEENIFTSNNKFSKEYLQQFSEKYEFIGKTKPSDYIERLQFILSNTDESTYICLILGVEIPCEKQLEYDFKNRHLSHYELNKAIKFFSKQNKRIKLVDLNEIVTSQSDFTNNINHFSSKVYYNIALKIQDIISEATGYKSKKISRIKLIKIFAIINFKKLIKRTIKDESKIFKNLLKLYKKL